MLIGFSFTRGVNLELVHRLRRERWIDFCELLIDNFLHVPPRELAAAFDGPVAFHIMFSKFIENDLNSLDDLARRLRTYIEELRPLYVSDHVIRFNHRGRQLYHFAEIDYLTEYPQVRERVAWWQERLGRRVYLENYPSIMDGGCDAPAFYERLTRDTGAGVLFDASNAVCAQRNCGLPLDAWEGVVGTTGHFHVAGYNHSVIQPYITLDTHDRELAPDTLAYLKAGRRKFDKAGATLCYERDLNVEYESIRSDLEKLRELFDASGEGAA